MIAQSLVFDAVRRGYNELELASNDEIFDYFADVNPDAMSGHISNIKGIVFEQEIVTVLNEQGIDAMLFEATNHPVSDITLMSDGDIAAEVQLKATDSVAYINETLAENPDIPIIVTSEVANSFDSTMVIDSGIDNVTLDEAVSEVLTGEIVSHVSESVASDVASEGLAELVADVALPISPIGIIGALFGLPFL
ncbi:cytochrome P450 [Shewanella sp. SM101]|uniref:cytochrome P450 n=1 Tax=unclassified Shewanella TaxID=196818 RepID=UPI0021D87D38|nr:MULTISPECIES: cytochrome P450 [unclassified Shewanella]MCU8032175.1 cytochrome P450 [Shewanella sp. SM73]MCU8105575.1 cytochrome P450 [Shewanella sp. SM101]